MGFLSYKAPMPDQVDGVKSTILYARPFRTQIAYLLGLIVLMNFGIFVMCCAAVSEIMTAYNSHPDGYRYWRLHHDDSSFSEAAVFFFFVPIPLAIWINSCVELYKRRRRTLQPPRVLISGCVNIVLLGLAGGLWSPCIYPPWYISGNRNNDKLGYCPFVSSDEGWAWIGADTRPPHAYYIIPWLLLPAALLYILYTVLGGLAYHHVRKERRINAPIAHQHEMYPDERYIGYSNVYPKPFQASDYVPSTIRSEIPSPVKTSPPPTYAKTTVAAGYPASYAPSRSVSSYSRDTKNPRGSVGPCTCDCPHH